jgi:predicted DNA-binding protein (MmcQ/YjbR family)
VTNVIVGIPFPKKVREKLVADGRAEPHHALPGSGWISFYIRQPADVERVIALFRQSFELVVYQRLNKTLEPEQASSSSL